MSYTLSIYNGFYAIDRQDTMDISAAERLLLTKKRKQYRLAYKEQDFAVLSRRRYVCPFCRNSMPDASRYLNSHRRCKGRMVTAEEIHHWADEQLSTVQNLGRDVLEINPTRSEPDMMLCPRCRKFFSPWTSRAHISIEVNREEQSIFVSCEVDTILTDLRAPVGELRFFPKDGKIFFRQKPGGWQDITWNYESFAGSRLWKYMEEPVFQRLMLRAFRDLGYSPALPVVSVTPDLFLYLTSFIGYPPRFYQCLPLSLQGCGLDCSFHDIAVRMHMAEEAPALYGEYLPKIKSIRRQVFTRPELLFFLPELSQLWQLFRNPDMLCNLLESNHCYTILADLHCYPSVLSFFTDYAQLCGRPRLYRTMTEITNWRWLMANAKEYALLNPELRPQLLAKPVRPDSREYPSLQTRAFFSYPVRVKCDLQDCRLQRYRFKVLRSTGDFIRAGDELHNCLPHYIGTSSSAVVVVEKDHHLKAAIEVLSNGQVIQALGPHNMTLSSELDDLVLRWISLNGLTDCRHGSLMNYPEHFIFDLDDDPDDEEDDLLFFRAL